jgi:hypothetical protein
MPMFGSALLVWDPVVDRALSTLWNTWYYSPSCLRRLKLAKVQSGMLVTWVVDDFQFKGKVVSYDQDGKPVGVVATSMDDLSRGDHTAQDAPEVSVSTIDSSDEP